MNKLLSKIRADIQEVKFDGCSIQVPEVKVGIKGRPVNAEILRDFGGFLRAAQTALDRIPTSDIGGYPGVRKTRCAKRYKHTAMA